MPRITITEPGRNPQPYQNELDTTSLKIGRAEDNDIVLTCPSVSAYHAELVRVAGGFLIQDLGSSNGVLRGDERLDASLLAADDEVMLGDVCLNFRLSEEETQVLAAEVEQKNEDGNHGSEPDAGGAAEDAPDGGGRAVPAAPKKPRNPLPRGHSPKALAGERRDQVITWLLVLAFFVFGAAAFYTGLSLRHRNETGMTLGQSTRARLATPDISRLSERDPELYRELFFKPEETESEPEIVVVPEDVIEPVYDIEGWEDRERREGMDPDASDLGLGGGERGIDPDDEVENRESTPGATRIEDDEDVDAREERERFGAEGDE